MNLAVAVSPMAADISIESDAFATTLSELLGRVETGIEFGMPEAVELALKKGEIAWKRNARETFSRPYVRGGWGKDGYGRSITPGKYARSIKHHMLSSGGRVAEGEIGSQSMPGLPHLLEHGHALVGGGRARAFEHIAPAADEAFEDFEATLSQAVEEAIENA